MSSNSGRALKLFKQQRGLCHWCGKPCIRAKEWLETAGKNPVQPPNLATLDHLDDKFSPERGKHTGKIRTVMACRRCNERRSARSIQRNSEEHRRRSAARQKNSERILVPLASPAPTTATNIPETICPSIM